MLGRRELSVSQLRARLIEREHPLDEWMRHRSHCSRRVRWTTAVWHGRLRARREGKGRDGCASCANCT